MVQWLKLHLQTQRVWVQSLVGELRSHLPCSQETIAQNRSNVAANSIKTLKVKDHSPRGVKEVLQSYETGDRENVGSLL